MTGAHFSAIRERGAALLTTLVIVAALSAIAVAALTDMRRSQQLTSNQQSLSQAQWFAIGADAYIRVIADELVSGALPATALAGGARKAVFPLDRGLMQISVTDGAACINLNSVVMGAGDVFERDELGAGQLTALMKLLSISSGDAAQAVSALVRWIDTGGGRVGSDDAAYTRLEPRYITGQEPLSEFSELRAISGFTADMVRTIRPFTCVLPQTGPSPVNLNALSIEQAPVLAALSLGRLSLSEARRVLERRPAAGWQSLGEAFSDPLMAGLGLDERIRSALRLSNTYLAVDVLVIHDEAEVAMSELLARRGADVVTVARRWSGDE